MKTIVSFLKGLAAFAASAFLVAYVIPRSYDYGSSHGGPAFGVVSAIVLSVLLVYAVVGIGQGVYAGIRDACRS